jgi:hypothetical protein
VARAAADHLGGVSDGQRLQRLRELLDQLERLPASAERERMLREVRRRFVDVETGEPPQAITPVEPEPTPVPRTVREPRPARKPRPPRTVAVPPPAPAEPVDPPSLGTPELLWLDDAAAVAPARSWTRGLRG